MRPLRAVLGLYVLAWLRSRGPWIWLALAAAVIWYDLEIGANAGPWWSVWVSASMLAGFLAGYDTYTRLREDGSVRLLLLQPARRGVVALSFWIAAGLLSAGMMLVFLVYLIIVGRAPVTPELAVAAAFVWVGSLGFVAYAQLGSLLLPRDAVAVAGLLVIVLGAGPLERWLPDAAPEWVRMLVGAIEYAIPMGARVTDLLAGSPATPAALGTVLLQILVVIAAIRAILSRPRIIARRGQT
ncbi:MAG TPA: hypothetical protein VF188_12530 [Longimicrobiales bacterium]